MDGINYYLRKKNNYIFQYMITLTIGLIYQPDFKQHTMTHSQQSYFRNTNTILPQTLIHIRIQRDDNLTLNLALANALHALKCLHTEE